VSERAAQIAALAPWFHNLHFADGLQTAPEHPLGDFPSYKWEVVSKLIPEDLAGWNVLDVGCNAGFYSFQLARRGARVLGIEHDPHYLEQAQWAAREYGIEEHVRFRQQSVYELGRSVEQFDLVLFMGVFYHLRHPLLALDLLARRTTRLMVFQTLTMPGSEVTDVPEDLSLMDRELLSQDGFPQMAFIEQRLAGDPTNWWAPNHAAVLAMLRSAGLSVLETPGQEIYLCAPTAKQGGVERQLVQQELLALGLL
jgi:tRNA (mo5U34)-methyltransferase